ASIDGLFAEITVGAGSSAVVFNLPKKLLCNSSIYFKAALNNGFLETTTQKITLDDEDLEVFRTYVVWLFQAELKHESLDKTRNVARHLVHVYIFADRRGIVSLADDVVTMMSSFWLCECLDTTPDPGIESLRVGTNKGFVETKEQTITLDDKDPKIFTTYVLWLYEKKLNKDTTPECSEDECTGCDAFQGHLSRLYVFADKRGILKLTNDILTMWVSNWINNPVNLSEITQVLPLILRESNLYKLVADMMALEVRLDHMTDGLSDADLSKEFVVDLLCRTIRLPEEFNKYFMCSQSACHYHSHDDQNVVSEEECIRRIEAGNNVFNISVDLKQKVWDWDY
ncbi:unnamed protein product, partial [Aureobasidium vineae]